MMNGAIVKPERITFSIYHCCTGCTMPGLLIGHSNSSVVCWPCISIRRIKEIKYLLGKIQPAIGIKIFRMISADRYLKISLPGSDHFMIGLRSRGKIIGVVYSLFVKIHMHMRHPLIVLNNALTALYLCLPGPITVQVKIIVIGPSTWPGFS